MDTPVLLHVCAVCLDRILWSGSGLIKGKLNDIALNKFKQSCASNFSLLMLAISNVSLGMDNINKLMLVWKWLT